MSGAPFHPSQRDLEILAEHLRRGDTAAKQSAIEELVRIGPAGSTLIPIVAAQIRNGLDIASTYAVELLVQSHDGDLLDALVVRGVTFNVFDKCRLLEAGIGDFEDELCTHLFRNWRRSEDASIREVLNALRRNGSPAAVPTLRAIEPDLAEAARAPGRIKTESPSDFLEALSREPLPGLARERLEILQDAIRQITERTQS